MDNLNIETTEGVQVNSANEILKDPNKRTSKNKFWMLTTFVLLATSIILVAFVIQLQINEPKKLVENNDKIVTNLKKEIIERNSNIEESKIIVPFVRSGSLYVYENGVERLIHKSKQSTDTNCYGVIYPSLSLNQKYIAFLEFTGQEIGYGGCEFVDGDANIFDSQTEKIISTTYQTQYPSFWNKKDQLEGSVEKIFMMNDKEGKNVIDEERSYYRYFIYDPAIQTEISKYEIKKKDMGELFLTGFPFNGDKRIEQSGQKYYLIQGNDKTFLYDTTEVSTFLDWSPNGVYALFHGRGNEWYAVNTEDKNPVKYTILDDNPAGGAGGPSSVGPKWYFNEAFFLNCDRELRFIDGRQSIVLSSQGGGGCHNEEGYVATSPDEKYAFLAFDDRFELREKSGDIKTVIEKDAIDKSRGARKFRWVDEENMIIYANGIFHYNVTTNVVKKVVEDGGLGT